MKKVSKMKRVSKKEGRERERERERGCVSYAVCMCNCNDRAMQSPEVERVGAIREKEGREENGMQL